MNDNDMEAIDKKINEVANDDLNEIEKHLDKIPKDGVIVDELTIGIE